MAIRIDCYHPYCPNPTKHLSLGQSLMTKIVMVVNYTTPKKESVKATLPAKRGPQQPTRLDRWLNTFP